MMKPLERFARRIQEDPFFLSPLLNLYAQSENLTCDALAERLGCTPEDLILLRLCRAPVQEPASEFQRDVNVIADRFHLNPEMLSEVVRRGQVLVQIRMQMPTGTTGTLLAARDADPDFEDDDAGERS